MLELVFLWLTRFRGQPGGQRHFRKVYTLNHKQPVSITTCRASIPRFRFNRAVIIVVSYGASEGVGSGLQPGSTIPVPTHE